MERKIVSFKEFKEILCNIGLNTYETEWFVHELINAVEVYGNYFLFYEEKAISMDLIQNEATIDCDIVCKGTRIEIAFNYSILEEITEEIIKERLIEKGVTPTEAEILCKFL